MMIMICHIRPAVDKATLLDGYMMSRICVLVFVSQFASLFVCLLAFGWLDVHAIP